MNSYEYTLFEEFASRFKRESTRNEHLSTINKLLDFSKCDLKSIDRIKANHFIDFIIEKNAYSTAEKTYSYLHAFFNYLLQNTFINDNPFKYVKKPIRSSEHNSNDILSFSEINFFLESVEKNQDIKTQALIFLFATTGASLLEISSLNWQDIVHTNDVNCCKIGVDKPRVLKLHRKAFEVIENYRISLNHESDIYNSETPLFLNRSNRRLSIHSISTMISRLFKEYGFENATAKTLRHSFASYCIYLQLDDRVIKRQMGWKQSFNMDIYRNAVAFVDDSIINTSNQALSKLEDAKIFYFDKK